MDFKTVIGNASIKKHLMQSAQSQRVAHAQLFVGNEGSGTLAMALAYAQELLCYKNGEKALSCCHRVAQLQHPDLHFVFPVNSNDKIKKTDLTSDDFMEDWISFVKENPYGSLNDWYNFISIGNKQGNINTEEAQNISRKLRLKSFEGGYQIMIIWQAERMNFQAANKLLKLLEEPPQKTIFILIAQQEKDLLPTITSRCQKVQFSPLLPQEISQALQTNYKLDASNAQRIALQAQGNYALALRLMQNNQQNEKFEKLFITWVRAAFKANKNAKVLLDLVQWSEELSGFSRENQKMFLLYCIDIFRQALFENYNVTSLVHFQAIDASFKLKNFAPFVNDKNIEDIFNEISQAIYHIERNGNPKIIFTDLSIKLTRLMHRK